MSRRHKHEEHTNHEAWAIPYADLLTLLLAFFVVMYAISSVNEGKYRVLSDSLFAAFRGSPRTLQPVQVGEKAVGSGADIQMTIVQQAMLEGQPRSMLEPSPINMGDPSKNARHASNTTYDSETTQSAEAVAQLETVAREVEQAMATLVDQNLIAVRRHGHWVEVEIRTDILFPSGVATLEPAAVNVMKQLAETLKPFPNPIRVEGHTDNRPISTRAFPSNWELSSARAASVVHLFTETGLEPARLAVIGLGEYRPAQDNATAEGRNANRRVVLVILSGDTPPEGNYAEDRGKQDEPAIEARDGVVDIRASATP
ncbi:MAG TPA: flagellar motor protein MotD [Povalibacter sp.]|uniref:flagellar motor protein MotD n=1 Tax=Povalibacter sp. TaxID=1962978 RepID=UPI002BF2C8D2|nr:flagellar motor protein MotD [Povalibacter sp.]HMN44411.1 flagellar motor protein MotD [Povalibacter sp.]